jgi:hypothetical protein
MRIKSNTITFKDYYYINNPKDISKLTSIEEINKKISLKNKGNTGYNNKPFYINNIYYKSLSIASKLLNIPKNTISNRLKNNKFKKYYYIK